MPSNNSLNSSFHAYISKLRWIKRWGLKRNSVEENVMEHSWEVSVIAHSLALIKNKYFNGDLDANAIATAALYHDVSEVLTGDMPTPIKYHSPSILNAYRQIEHQAELELLNLLPKELREDFRPLLIHDEMPKVCADIIKSADRISAYLKCQLELKAGNQEFHNASLRLTLDIQENAGPETVFFMKHFAPNCGLTLDDLILATHHQTDAAPPIETEITFDDDATFRM